MRGTVAGGSAGRRREQREVSPLAKNKRLAGPPSTTRNRAAGAAAMVRLAALGVSIGTGCTLPFVAAYTVIFLAGPVVCLVAWRDSIPRPAGAARAKDIRRRGIAFRQGP